MSSGGSSKAIMHRHHVTLPQISDDEDNVPINDHPDVRKARARVVDYEKHRTARAEEAKKAVAQAKESAITQKQGNA
jgi:hypothetical protein